MKVSRIRTFLECSIFRNRGKIFQPIMDVLSPHQKKHNRPIIEAAFRNLSVSYLHYRCFVRPYKKAANATSLARLRKLAEMKQSVFARIL